MTLLSIPAESALSWVEAHLDQFSVRKHARDDHEYVVLLKPLSELALTASLLGRDARLRERCRHLVEWAWEEADRGSGLLRLTSARPELVECVGLYACVYGFGKRNGSLHDWFNYLAGSALVDGLEIPAWRRTALRYNFARLGLADAPQESVVGSWLGALPEPWTFSDTTGYAMTHEVFYLTDFGVRPETLTAHTVAYLAQWLPAWWRCARDFGNHDLAAELIMVGACTRTHMPSEALTELLTNQRSDGRVVGPAGAGGDLPRPDGDEARCRFLSDYHTTLVTLLALTTQVWACRPAVHEGMLAPACESNERQTQLSTRGERA